MNGRPTALRHWLRDGPPTVRVWLTNRMPARVSATANASFERLLSLPQM